MPVISKYIFSLKIFSQFEKLSAQDAFAKLKQLQIARNEIAEKIQQHKHPDEIPKLKAVLVKFELGIEEIKKIIPSHMLALIDPMGMEYVKLPGGKFVMGSEEFSDNPPHEVTLKPFEMAQTLVTQKQWREQMGENIKPSFNFEILKKNTDDHPMETIWWNAAVQYCKNLSFKAPDIDVMVKSKIKEMNDEEYIDFALQNPNLKLYRLPTEAEWEYAAKAGKNYEFGTADGKRPEKETSVWGRVNYEGTLPVTYTKPNEFGLYDMAGNVSQWTASWYQSDFYKRGENYIDPIGPPNGEGRVCRGGSWENVGTNPFLTTIRRGRDPLLGVLPSIGFRPVRYIGDD